MKVLFFFLSLMATNVFAEVAPQEVTKFFDGTTRAKCGEARIEANEQGDSFIYGVDHVINSYQTFGFKTLTAFGETFKPQYQIVQKDHMEILNLSLYSMAIGGSWSPDRPGITWGVNKFTFKVVKDLSEQKIVSIEMHELIRRKTILGTLKKNWKEENSSASCSDI